MMSAKRIDYIPAAGLHCLTPVYDPLQRWLMREAAIKRHLVEQARIADGHRVLDLGCGTGTLAILVEQLHPRSRVVGLDVDAGILARAAAKAARAGVGLQLVRGTAFQLPYADRSFDRVVSSLVFHHLTTEHKRRALREVFRVLRPHGSVVVADLGKPHNALTYLASLISRWFEETAANVKGLLPTMLRAAGFEQVGESARYTTPFGTVSLYEARKPYSA